MKRLLLSLLLLASADSAFAQLVGAMPGGVAVAHDGALKFVAEETRWSVEGVPHPTSLASGAGQVIVLDALANEAVIVDVASGRSRRIRTAETPVAALFAGNDLFILARDARVLQRVGGPDIALPADPAFLAAAGGRVYVYSRVSGTLAEIEHDRVTRSVGVAPFASDLEVDGTTAFLAYPHEAKLRVVDLKLMKGTGDVAVGAVPVDIALAGGGTALTARILAVADPSAKRVWMTESTQSTAKAVARGFLRGFLGLGLFGNRASRFPTGVDRVARAGSTWAAYDSSSGTLYRFTKAKSSVVATGVEPGAWAISGDAIVWWSDGRLHRLGVGG